MFQNIKISILLASQSFVFALNLKPQWDPKALEIINEMKQEIVFKKNYLSLFGTQVDPNKLHEDAAMAMNLISAHPVFRSISEGATQTSSVAKPINGLFEQIPDEIFFQMCKTNFKLNEIENKESKWIHDIHSDKKLVGAQEKFQQHLRDYKQVTNLALAHPVFHSILQNGDVDQAQSLPGAFHEFNVETFENAINPHKGKFRARDADLKQKVISAKKELDDCKSAAVKKMWKQWYMKKFHPDTCFNAGIHLVMANLLKN